MTPGGLNGLLGRIAGIEARFQPADSAPPPEAPPPPTGFEPFGEVYRQAVERSVATPVAATATPAVGASASATLLPGSQPRITEHPQATSPASVPARVAAAIAGVAGPAGARPVGGYGAMPRPAELSGYGNGRIPSAALATVNQSGSNHRLHAPAAASWNNLVAEAAREGFDLRITDSYRSYEQQVDLAERKGLYKDGGYAAVPGTSNHGWGLAVDADVRNPDLQRWLQRNAPRFGWVEAVPREPWHWEFRPDQV